MLSVILPADGQQGHGPTASELAAHSDRRRVNPRRHITRDRYRHVIIHLPEVPPIPTEPYERDAVGAACRVHADRVLVKPRTRHPADVGLR